MEIIRQESKQERTEMESLSLCFRSLPAAAGYLPWPAEAQGRRRLFNLTQQRC